MSGVTEHGGNQRGILSSAPYDSANSPFTTVCIAAMAALYFVPPGQVAALALFVLANVGLFVVGLPLLMWVDEREGLDKAARV